MAVATGTQIRPELSAVDYTPFLQAASQSAQAQAQGIAAFGQGVSQGIQNFLKKREEKQNEQEGIAFIKSFDPSISDEAARAGLKAAGGAAAFVKFKSDYAAQQDADRMRRIQLAEFERSVEEKKKLDEAMKYATSPVVSREIAAGVPFEKLSAGAAAFARPSTSTSDFIARAQASGVSPTVYAPLAQTLSQVEENLAKAESMRMPKPVGIEELRFRQQMGEKEADARIRRRADQIVYGTSTTPLANEDEELRAKAMSVDIAKKGRTEEDVVKSDPATGRTVVVKQFKDIKGNVISEVPRYEPVPSPEEQARAQGLIAEEQSAVKWLEAFDENASSTNIRLAKNKTAINLLSSGQVQTGPASNVIQIGRRLLSTFGGNPKTIADTAKFGVVVNILGDQLIDYFQKTKGAISDYETRYFSNLAAKETKTNAENIAILKMANAIDERTIASRQALDKAKASGSIKTKSDERQFIRNYVNSNPLDFDSFLNVSDPVVERNLRKKK
jgi:hypothetical protein